MKTIVELILSQEQKHLLKLQRSNSVLDSEPEDTSMKMLAATLNDKGAEDRSTLDLLKNLVARKEQLDPMTLKLLYGALSPPSFMKQKRAESGGDEIEKTALKDLTAEDYSGRFERLDQTDHSKADSFGGGRPTIELKATGGRGTSKAKNNYLRGAIQEVNFTKNER